MKEIEPVLTDRKCLNHGKIQYQKHNLRYSDFQTSDPRLGKIFIRNRFDITSVTFPIDILLE